MARIREAAVLRDSSTSDAPVLLIRRMIMNIEYVQTINL
jgi:hypothetical protein